MPPGLDSTPVSLACFLEAGDVMLMEYSTFDRVEYEITLSPKSEPRGSQNGDKGLSLSLSMNIWIMSMGHPGWRRLDISVSYKHIIPFMFRSERIQRAEFPTFPSVSEFQAQL